MTIKATKTRKYPELEEGRKVMRRKNITEKDSTSHWNNLEIKTVRKIETKSGQKYYTFWMVILLDI